jgi:mRNA interferase YafQ
MTSKSHAPDKRAKLPRKSDRTKQFDKDWTRLHNAGRTNLRRLKDLMLLLIADDTLIVREIDPVAVRAIVQ